MPLGSRKIVGEPGRHLLASRSSDSGLGPEVPASCKVERAGDFTIKGGPMTVSSIFVGIDISKAQLDIAQRPSASRPVLPHTDTGIATLVEQLRRLRPVAIGLEAPGGVEVLLVTALATAGLSVRVVNPRQMRAFAKATGQLAKTDPIDAQGLAHFAEAVRPTPRPLPDAATQALSARLTRRRQLLER